MTPARPTVRDDGSPYVRPQTAIAPAGSSGSYVPAPDYSPLQGPISRQQFVDPRELIELNDADSVYMVLQPGSYAIDDQGNLMLMPGLQAQGMRPGRLGPSQGQRQHGARPNALRLAGLQQPRGGLCRRLP